MSDLAQLIIAALKWDAARGFAAAESEAERALALGVGGFAVLGGERDAVAVLTARLRAASRHPLLVAVLPGSGATESGAIAQASSAHAGRAPHESPEVPAGDVATRLDAREALAVGANWMMVPATAVDAVQREGVLACVGRFPGEDRVSGEAQLPTPRVIATRDELQRDLAPFVDAIDAGAASIMTAHVAYPVLDASGVPASTSRAIVHGLLRETLGFDGVIVTAPLTDGLGWEPRGEGHLAARAVAAGCDLVFLPYDPAAALHGLEVAVGRTVPRSQLDASLARRDYWARWASR